jgi:hypothetical protein
MVFAVALTVLLANSILSPTSPNSGNIKHVYPHYLTDQVGNETRIFLDSAIPSYGKYPFHNATGYPGKPDIHAGDTCFIVNVTVRNDYSSQNPLPSGGFGDIGSNGTAFVALTAKLNDGNGNVISATNVTPQYPNIPPELNAPEMSLESNETYSFNMYLVTKNQNIDHFSIEVLYLGSVPAP